MFTDPVLNELIARYPPPSWTDRSEHLFEDLIETIISQQLSGKVAINIFKRFKKLFSSNIFPSPKEVLCKESSQIKQIGMSQAKTQYIQNVAQAFVSKYIIISDISNMSDKEVITHLTSIKGIGQWSAEMILIFTLNRPDVFSLGDLGLRKAIEKLYKITDKREILTLTNQWSPHRSLASWYLWRSLEN